MEFEWDPNKEAANLAKHGITFADALTVFDDPRHFIETAPDSSSESNVVLPWGWQPENSPP